MSLAQTRSGITCEAVNLRSDRDQIESDRQAPHHWRPRNPRPFPPRKTGPGHKMRRGQVAMGHTWLQSCGKLLVEALTSSALGILSATTRLCTCLATFHFFSNHVARLWGRTETGPLYAGCQNFYACGDEHVAYHITYLAKRTHNPGLAVRVDLNLADFIATVIGLFVRTSDFGKDRPARTSQLPAAACVPSNVIVNGQYVDLKS